MPIPEPQILVSPRDVVSPRPGRQHDSKSPLWPGDAGFEDSLMEVVDTVARVETGGWPSEFMAKGNPSGSNGDPAELLIKKLSLTKVAPRRMALAVSMDKPWHLGEMLLDELLARGAQYQEVRPGTVQFCDRTYSYTATMADLLASTSFALDRVFDVKFFWKKPRAEDFMRTPGCIFTVDNLGAPGHWGYGAGHAAVAGATRQVLHRALTLPLELSAMVDDACWQFAAGRTLLGVHFYEDNAEGYRIGLQF